MAYNKARAEMEWLKWKNKEENMEYQQFLEITEEQKLIPLISA
ncbi:MAG TPA: hypothetical protein PKY16_01075 [Gemmiger qucibialis]|jgi:hypothetical protein|nr:hypothetical protein [Gemmiger qucibialis]HRM26617.1 hypothetical protein [Gemmiger qucibialis]HRM78625.1 hypothetical protein [Gemmiger qucibialis]